MPGPMSAWRLGSRRSVAGGREAMGDDFTKQPAPDRLVRRGAMAPPPAVLLHRLGGRYKAIGDRVKIGVAVIEAEDQPPGSDPAQRQALRAKVILQHPVVAR